MECQEGEKAWDFDSWADRYDQAVATDSQHYFAQYDAVLDAVVELAQPSSGERVLDVGTGLAHSIPRINFRRSSKHVCLSSCTSSAESSERA